MAGIYYRFRLKGNTDWIGRSARFARELETAMSGAMMDVANAMINEDMASSIATWKHKGEIRFEAKTRLSAKSVTVTISTDHAIFNFVEGGTEVRYATMTKGFKAKTTPGSLGSGPGHGGLAYIDKAKPRAGIEARNFYKVSAEKRRPEFVARAKKIFINQLRKFGAR